jgi:phosphatidylglycerol---prolipoprotein diacylglyceryl transferase
MLRHPCIDPVALHLGTLNLGSFQFGPIQIRWYGLMYLLGFIVALALMRLRARKMPEAGWTPRQVDDLLFYAVLGVIVGGRLGYALFYMPGYYAANPGEQFHLLDIFKIWQGGMSFHGGFLGVIFAMWLFARQHGKRWLQVTDFIAPVVLPGYIFGRLGNFANGELYGRVTDVSWGMLFPKYWDDATRTCVWPEAAEAVARHPSQLYQAALEGLLLFIVLWIFSGRPRPLGAVSGLFLLGYGLCRFLVEFTRQPDEFLGTLGLGLSMGQWLSVPMVIGGVVMLRWAYRTQQPSGTMGAGPKTDKIKPKGT